MRPLPISTGFTFPCMGLSAPFRSHCRHSWLRLLPCPMAGVLSRRRTRESGGSDATVQRGKQDARQLDEIMTVQCIFRLCRANAEGDNLIIENTVFPLLRQQTPHPDGSPFLCLSDFVRPLASGIPDTVGLLLPPSVQTLKPAIRTTLTNTCLYRR